MKILFLSQSSGSQNSVNDYMHDIVFHGLKKIYGDSIIDYPGVWYMHKDEVKKQNYNIKNLWGKGFTLYNLLDGYDKIDRENIKDKIVNNYFDIIIYGAIHTTKTFLENALISKSKLIFIDGSDSSFINKELIGKGLYFKRELYENISDNIYPISFAVPEEKIMTDINHKPNHILAPLIPGKNSTYNFNDETDYYEMYQDSIFALTYKKIGWDTLRHCEILMNGTIPLFLDIENCPENTLYYYPKDLLKDINKKYSYILNRFSPFKIYKSRFLTSHKIYLYLKDYFKKNNTASELLNKYPEIYEIKKNLLNFTKKNLTSEVMVNNILKKI